MNLRAPGFFARPVEDLFLANARDLIKPKVTMNAEKIEDDIYLQLFKYLNTKQIDIHSSDTKLSAFEISSTNQDEKIISSDNKKALIYMSGNCPWIGDSISAAHDLFKTTLEKINSSDHHTINCYYQHYRGRGVNENKENNFNDYPMFQDMLDQAALIKKLIYDGYRPEDIFIIGYSYGSAIGLWAIQYLSEKFGDEYKNIKICSDRSFGNMFNWRYCKPFVLDQTKAHTRLHEIGMISKIPPHEIVKLLPNSFIFEIVDDESIGQDIALSKSFKPEELPGRIWIAETEVKKDRHFSKRETMHLKYINELTMHDFLAAILTETPIKINFTLDKAFQDEKSIEPVLKNNATVITSNALNQLIKELYQHCIDHARKAAQSKAGPDYKRSLLGKLGITNDFTAKDEIDKTRQILNALIALDGPDFKVIKELKKENGPHQSGKLGELFNKVFGFIYEYESLNKFNEWILTMNAQYKNSKSTQNESLMRLSI